MTKSVSLCLIVKDEAANLRACVSSARKVADEVVIVDTGSQDETPLIARKLADRFAQTTFRDDFSAARNEALTQASGDWILFLDADERISRWTDIKETIESAKPETYGVTFLRYNFFANGGFFTTRELKLFRHDARIFYRRRINESVGESIHGLGGEIVDSELVLNHFGHCRPVSDRVIKAHRYLDLMARQEQENPGDALIVAYQGLILRTLGRIREALEYANRAIDMAPGDPLINLFLGHVVRAAMSAEEARDAYLRGLELSPSHPALLNMVGVQNLVLGDLSGAESCFTRARLADRALLHTDINLGLVAEARNDFPLAVQFFERAAQSNPFFLHESWLGRVEWDPYRPLYYETPFGYAGLAFHLGHGKLAASRQRSG